MYGVIYTGWMDDNLASYTKRFIARSVPRVVIAPGHIGIFSTVKPVYNTVKPVYSTVKPVYNDQGRCIKTHNFTSYDGTAFTNYAHFTCYKRQPV